jgi:hypothetical protein
MQRHLQHKHIHTTIITSVLQQQLRDTRSHSCSVLQLKRHFLSAFRRHRRHRRRQRQLHVMERMIMHKCYGLSRREVGVMIVNLNLLLLLLPDRRLVVASIGVAGLRVRARVVANMKMRYLRASKSTQLARYHDNIYSCSPSQSMIYNVSQRSKNNTWLVGI